MGKRSSRICASGRISAPSPRSRASPVSCGAWGSFWSTRASGCRTRCAGCAGRAWIREASCLAGSGRQLWEASALQRGDYAKQLSVTILALLYGTGLRRGELERLNVQDWDREQNLLAVDGRKSARERSIPLSEPIARCLEAYLP